jgi:O-antigen ligase
MSALALALALGNHSRLSKLKIPPHIVCLLLYAGFAGLSVLWAFKPATSFTRYTQQIMVITSIVLPAMLAGRTVDLMRGLILCFSVAVFINVYFLFTNSEADVNHFGGYRGYFDHKNSLGEFSAPALLLGLHLAISPGGRRGMGIIVAAMAIVLLMMSGSKTAFALALIAPVLATAALMIRKYGRVSIAVVLVAIPLGYIVLNKISPNINTGRLSYMMYGDPTFTGRTIIWDFAQREIDRSPLVGWGYQSFWLVGPDGPSVVEAPGFVKEMPNAHNGYYDTKLEMGYVGFTLLIAFILSTLHAIGRVADRDPARARIVLSLALYVIIHNCLESLWMRGTELLWVLFLLLAADIARYWQPSPQTRTFVRRGPRWQALLAAGQVTERSPPAGSDLIAKVM